MGRQKKKENLAKPQEKAKSFVEPWQHPHETNHLMQNISFHGVAKSWRAAPKRCRANAQLPWLEISSKDYYQSKIQEHILNIPFRPGEYWWYGRRPWGTPWTHFHGCSHGLIVAGEKDPAEYCLLIPNARNSYWTLPPWDTTIPFKFATLSSNPSNNYKDCFLMVLTGCCNPAFVVCHLRGQNKWMKEESTLLDPNGSKRKIMQFTNAIGFKGKFYALSLQGTLAVIEEIESKFQITKLSRSRAVPSVFSKNFTEYLLESTGEILLIFLISEQSTTKVDKVEVCKLQMDDLSWLKLDNLGNRTLSNCVYFNEHANNTWRFYEMRSDTISPCLDDYGSETKSPVWEEPIAENKFLVR
ncbi:unnamed protein product [Withania somnifera]